uniref:Uncharacterized protein n=1 Tax=Aotus nancymaae TaxID=37293 RepID=A0A2K5EMX6_AOTNA
MSIMSYNGGAIMAMKGKDCVAIAADRHFWIQARMVTTDFQIFPVGDRLYIGLAELATDVQIVIKPYTLMSLVASLLYEKHFAALGFPHQLQSGPRVDPLLRSNAEIPGFIL